MTHPRVLRWARFALSLTVGYFLVAYLIVPRFWKRRERKHQDLRDDPTLTHTASGIPGDPLNISLVGSEQEAIRALTAAGWYPANPLTFRSSVRIAVDTVFRRPDDDAPVSNLYLFGRKKDLAFEKPVGAGPKERHHVRFWQTKNLDEGRVVWIGSAAYDIGVEFSRTTGEITHRISPNVYAERDLLIADLTKAGRVSESRWVGGFHKELQGRNGGGDMWRTDGRLAVVALKPLTILGLNPAPEK
jgi:LssY C-terminus